MQSTKEISDGNGVGNICLNYQSAAADFISAVVLGLLLPAVTQKKSFVEGLSDKKSMFRSQYLQFRGGLSDLKDLFLMLTLMDQ